MPTRLLPAIILVLAAISASAEMKFIANPCGVLTEQEVSAILGAPAKIGMKMDAAGMCMFKGPNGQPAFSVQGFIFDNTHDSTENYESMARVVPPKSVETLSGVGDRAEIVTTAQGDIMLYILKGTRMVSLSLLHGPPPNTGLAARKPALTQGAKQAAGRF